MCTCRQPGDGKWIAAEWLCCSPIYGIGSCIACREACQGDGCRTICITRTGNRSNRYGSCQARCSDRNIYAVPVAVVGGCVNPYFVRPRRKPGDGKRIGGIRNIRCTETNLVITRHRSADTGYRNRCRTIIGARACYRGNNCIHFHGFVRNVKRNPYITTGAEEYIKLIGTSAKSGNSKWISREWNINIVIGRAPVIA